MLGALRIVATEAWEEDVKRILLFSPECRGWCWEGPLVPFFTARCGYLSPPPPPPPPCAPIPCRLRRGLSTMLPRCRGGRGVCEGGVVGAVFAGPVGGQGSRLQTQTWFAARSLPLSPGRLGIER